MIGQMQKAAPAVVLVAAHKIVTGIDGHVRSGHRNVLVARDIGARRIIHLVISASGDGKRGYIAFAVVKNGMHIGRKHRLIMIVHFDGRIGPPQKGLGQVGPVVDFHLDLDIGFAGMQSKTGHTFGARHPLQFAAPDGSTAVGVFLQDIIQWLVSGRPVMLRPVKLDAPRNPGSGEADQSRLDNAVVINKMALQAFVVCHLNAAAQGG